MLAKGVTHYYEPLDAERMHRAAQCLLGENDFTSFRAVQCQSRTPWRNVMHINVTRHGPYVVSISKRMPLFIIWSGILSAACWK
ncbi:tRNA pseudouridine synthase A [Salmonella enterica subsp. enterica]|uniref:tRNA pseudouridine synthase A n=1 Tax=Salmonella enterica I TaxID=59201 RepID=A0A379WPH8_SALET|nr:tRNA pseudouridine synthase A [Salmonella enterica subsp. enterica]